jgi:phytoene/squalene synthetase
MTQLVSLSKYLPAQPSAAGDDALRLLARRITHAASKQTDYTIRFLVDPPLINTAYTAYAYFRWVDDTLDNPSVERESNLRFIERQRDILLTGTAPNLKPAEKLLCALLGTDDDPDSRLHSYVNHMMAVMSFDAARRGCVVSADELAQYTRHLAAAVTDMLHYCIGHDTPPAPHPARYLAVTGAHITHMLRDTYEDVANGYYNISSEYLAAHHLQPTDTDSDAYRAWVMSRVGYARQCFSAGKRYLAGVPSLRCRVAGFAYTARFEQVLDAIQRNDFRLRPRYDQRKTIGGALGLVWSTLAMMLEGIGAAA